jgi:quercetin dioxygenase-like cupin family protein
MIDRAPPDFSHIRAGGGRSNWLFGNTYTAKATADSTGDAFSLLETSVPPGGGPPPHVHTGEDEALYLLDGMLTITIAEETVIARTGDFVFLPRGIAHAFINPSVDAARALILITPAGLERYFREAGSRARPGEQAPPVESSEHERIAEIGNKYGLQITTRTDAHGA